MTVDSQFGIYDLAIVESSNTSIDAQYIDYTNFILWFTDNMPSDISEFTILVSINDITNTLPFINSGYGTSNDNVSNKFFATFSNDALIQHSNVVDESNITVQVRKGTIVMGNWSGLIKINAAIDLAEGDLVM
jgi:hypothetical protein